jgi:hypothetical protein
LTPVFGQPEAADRFFERDGIRYELKIAAKEISEAGAPADLVRFRVLRDGVFVPTGRPDGGRLVSYKYAYGEPAEVRVQRLDVGGAGAGWIVGACGSAGNARHWDFAVITLRDDGDAKSRFHSEVHTSAKEWPVLRDLGRAAELWAFWQDWGRGGTVSSIYVPYRLAIEPGAPARRAPLPPDFDAWPGAFEGRSFPGAFVAGMRERSPELMSAALSRLWAVREVDWYAGYGLPRTPAELHEMIELTRRIRDAYRSLDALVPGTDARWDPVPR